MIARGLLIFISFFFVSCIDHFRIIHDSSGSTCSAESVRVVACANASCSILSWDDVTVDFQANGVTKTALNFTGSTTFDITHLVDEAVTFSVANSTVEPDNVLVCDSGRGSSCDMTFSRP